ncbi:hydrogenase [Photobacterium sanctipauli]|uniref:Hydrogenase n=1 Tax=Photobacterium sanctipauli TaxID=1342794 RepID=A0A2T3P0C4_9GAMM|nr:cytochrome b/b6 domain-containing protein [Photobacterium sanctipauli]PSW21932.1 hydrogenase [Photobacterium sanctipauli]
MKTQIWDLPTRLYHWLQAILFIGLAASGFSGHGPHLLLGLGLFCLLVWRLGWGIIGSETSRFKQFVRSPKTVINYFRGKANTKVGHNPAGGWMVVALLTTLLLQCLSGMLIAGLFDSLPLASTLLTDDMYTLAGTIHGLLARLLPMLVIAHLVAIAAYKVMKKPMVMAMITGKQFLPAPSAVKLASNRKALMLFIASVSVTMAIIA